MRAIIDNNLPVTLAERIAEIDSALTIEHVVNLGVQHLPDAALKRLFHDGDTVWITRDEDFVGFM